MPRRLLRLSLLFSVGSLLFILLNVWLGQRVYYLDHLALFNATVAVVLALIAAALGVGLAGLWKARGRSGWLWFASAVPLVLVGVLVVFG